MTGTADIFRNKFNAEGTWKNWHDPSYSSWKRKLHQCKHILISRFEAGDMNNPKPPIICFHNYVAFMIMLLLETSWRCCLNEVDISYHGNVIITIEDNFVLR